MSPMRKTERGEELGPTWGNVQVTARYVSRTHHCFVRCVMEPKLLKDDIYAMEIRAEAWVRGVGKHERRVEHIAKQWPNRDHRTMPGMLYGMLMALDERMEELASAKQAELPF